MCAETRGKTLHLLKKQAKPVPQNRKRVQRDIYASPLDFQRLHPDFEEQKHEPEVQVELRRDLGYVPVEGGPNQIGNMEDGPVMPDNVEAERYPGTPPPISHPDGGGDEIMYVPVTPKRTEAQIARMASRRGKSKERPQ